MAQVIEARVHCMYSSDCVARFVISVAIINLKPENLKISSPVGFCLGYVIAQWHRAGLRAG
jgi:hypothetical protein